MKRFLAPLFAALALGWCAPAAAAIGSPFNIGSATSSVNETSHAVVTTADCPLGDTAILAIASNLLSSPTVIDSAGNTWTRGTVQSVTGGTYDILYAHVATDLPSGGTITPSWTGSSKATISAACVSGLASTSPLDVGGTGVTGTSADNTPISPAATSGTLGQASELVIGVLMTVNSHTLPSASGYTLLGTITPGGNSYLEWGYQIVSSTASVSFAPQWHTARVYGANIWTFKGAGGAPPSSAPSLMLLGVGQ